MRRGRRRRRLAIAAVGLSVAVTLTAGLLSSAAFGGIGVRVGKSVFQIHKVDEANFSATSTDPVFVLVLGNDARPGLAGARADAIHLIGVNPAAGAATILNIPRDTYVNVPGHGMDKINSAFDVGGPRLQAITVGAVVGVDIHYVITTGFDGLMDMVDELGGVDVNIPVAMADANSGAYFSAGPNHLLGGPALALSRNRNLAGGDFTRTTNQSLIILAALAKLRAEGTGLSDVVRYLAVLLKHATFDGAGMTDLYKLGQLALSIDPANVRSITMPGVAADTPAGSSVLMVPAANALFADFRDDAMVQSS